MGRGKEEAARRRGETLAFGCEFDTDTTDVETAAACGLEIPQRLRNVCEGIIRPKRAHGNRRKSFAQKADGVFGRDTLVISLYFGYSFPLKPDHRWWRDEKSVSLKTRP